MLLNLSKFIFLIFPIVLCYNLTEQNKNLVKTVILFRHGMRAPIKPFYFDGNFHEDLKYWPNGYGNLVENGKWQMFNLGQRLHERYKNFITPYGKTIAEDIKVVTTAVYRCYQSANYLLAGLYPLTWNQTWSEELKDQPVPILYTSPDKVRIASQKDVCPTYSRLLENKLRNISNIGTLKQLMLNFSSHVNVSSINELFIFIDYIRVKLEMNIKIPEWITKDSYRELQKSYVNSFDLISCTVQMTRLIAGPLIKDIVLRFKEVIYHETTNSKIFLYSGHDLSLHTLAKLLGFHLNFVPSYAASLIFEVYRFTASDYKIRLLYGKNHLLNDMEVWTIPKCEEFCPVGRFIQIVEKFFIDNWEEECNIS